MTVIHSPAYSSAYSPIGGRWGAGVTDPYFSYIKLLCGFNGADAATSSTDESPSPRTLTFVADAQLDTAQKKFGTASLLVDGTGDYVSAPDSADWVFDGEFTLEAWMRPAALGATAILAQWAAGNSAWSFELVGTGQMRFRFSTDGSTTAHDLTTTGTAIATGTWYHVAVDRGSDSKMRVYVDGVMRASKATATGTCFDSTAVLGIGARASAAIPFNGHLDEVRITKGIARYASDDGFALPSAAFPRS